MFEGTIMVIFFISIGIKHALDMMGSKFGKKLDD
jgi:hypothetical protein